MRSHRFAVALAVSLFLHGALLFSLRSVVPPPRHPVTPKPGRPVIEIELQAVSPPQSAASAPSTLADEPQPAVPPTRRKRQVAKPVAKAPAVQPQAEPGVRGAEESPSGVPKIGDAPRRTHLAPTFAMLAPSDGKELASGESDRQAEHELESEEVRVKSRIDRMLKDEIAYQRVEKGLVDPYFGDLKHALTGAVRSPPKFDAHPVRGFVQSWARAANAYGKGEDPLGGAAAPLSPGGMERLRSFRESMEGSGTTILAIVEIRQEPDGKLKAITLIESSGHRDFDAYVLETAPRAIEALSAPPAAGLGIHSDELRSAWAFSAKTVYRRKLRDMNPARDWWYLAVAAPLNLLGGSFDETSGDAWITDLRNPSVQCDVRLLAVY